MALISILPTLRSTLPDPIRGEMWPDGTTVTTSDVLIDGVSLLNESLRGPLPYRFDSGERSVVIARVSAQVDGLAGRIDLVLNAPDGPKYEWSEARLLGRSSRTRAGAVHLSSRTWWQCAPCSLPRDVTLGDLVAVPAVRS